MKRSLAIATLLGIAFCLVGQVAADDDTALKPASAKTGIEKAPSFVAKDTMGKKHDLSDYKDKIVVLEWMCPRCPAVRPHYESKNIQRLVATYKEKDVVWLAVCSSSFQTAEELNEFAKGHGVKHPILLDSDGKIGHAYGAKTTPHMFIIQGGKKLYEGAIDSGPAKGADDKVVNYVAQALDEILAGKPVSTRKTRPYGCNVKYAPGAASE